MNPLHPTESATVSGSAHATADATLLQLLESAAGAGTWRFDLPSRQLHLSAALRTLLSLPDDADIPVPGHPADLYAPEVHALMAARVLACEQDGQAFDEESQIVVHGDSSHTPAQRLWVRSIGRAVRDDTGAVHCLHGVLIDITDAQRARHETMSVTMRLSTTLASINEAFVTLDRAGCILFVNPEAEHLLQQPAPALLGRSILQQLGGAEGGELQAALGAMVASGEKTELEAFYPALQKWLEVRAYPFEDGIAVYLRDVTERRMAQEQVLLLQTSISRLNDVVMITEGAPLAMPGPRIVFVNDAFERLTGYSKDEVLGRTPRILQGRRTQREELARIRDALLAAKPVRAELINYKKNGDPFWLELEVVPVDYFSRGLTHWVAVSRDITARKAAEDEIEHLAFYDALTQLPNRQLLMDRLDRAVTPRRGETRTGALMFIDLDHFKGLNDTLGHARGDMLLQQVATRLAGCMRLSDTVARLGGDEFVVMLEDLKETPEDAILPVRQVGEKVLATLSEPYDLAGHQHHSTCSIGITIFSVGEGQPIVIGDLLKQADLAMYQSKASGRNAVSFFDPDMQAAATAHASLSIQLRQGLLRQEFVLHYQPQVGRNNRVFGVEALVRWQHPSRGLVYPDAFIPQAEDSSLILPLGEWVLETACAQLAAWAGTAATAALSISVNVSARQFRHPEFVERVLDVVQRHRVKPQRLKLELTESLLATGIDTAIARMGLLKQAGVTLSIDDFGMGYSALSYLKHLPLDQLKIDRTFVKDVLTDPNDAAIARTIIGLAQSLGLGVVAEGVETEAQREWLARYGCECFQGYLFSKALPVDQLEDFLKQQDLLPAG
ncbi:MAG: EAL domain-containing protein [Polaromonas sp.]|nr:EAL domain-containing protein [Polaromonas sp.]